MEIKEIIKRLKNIAHIKCLEQKDREAIYSSVIELRKIENGEYVERDGEYTVDLALGVYTDIGNSLSEKDFKEFKELAVTVDVLRKLSDSE